MKILNVISLTVAVVLASSLAVVMPALAQTSVPGAGATAWGGVHNGANGGMRRGAAAPGIFGTVGSVVGDTLTVTAMSRPMRPMPGQASTSAPSVTATPTVYTVDATSATVYKAGATTTISSVAQGDTVFVQGTVTGTSVVATVIRDGVTGMMGGKNFGNVHGASSTMPRPSSTPIIQGNGEPVVGGAVTAISSTTLTVTNASNVTYTIDAASSTIVVKGVNSTLASIAVGDNVLVQGTVNGNSVTASSIIDQGTKGTNASSTNASPTKSRGGFGGFGANIGAGLGGFFGSIGGFFQHLFGF